MSVNINTTLKQNEKDLINNFIKTFSNSILQNFNGFSLNLTENNIFSIGVNEINGFMVGITNGASTNNFIFSNDGGYSWSYYNKNPINNQWRSITWGNGKFVAVGNGTTNFLMYSASTSPSSGSDWNYANNISPSNWKEIIFGGNTFVAIADSGTVKIIISINGQNWTNITNLPTLPADSNLNNIVYGNGSFVITTASSNGNRIIYSNDNGVTWFLSETTPNFSSSDKIIYSYKLKKFFIIGSSNQVFTSINGKIWDSVSKIKYDSLSNNGVFKIIWINELELFVLFGLNTSNFFIISTSFDGINWNNQYTHNEYKLFTSLVWNSFFGVIVGTSILSESISPRFFISQPIGNKHLLNKIYYSNYENFENITYNITDYSTSINSYFSLYPILNINNDFFEYSIFPDLPNGLTINTSNGVISGSSSQSFGKIEYVIYAKHLLTNKTLFTKININITTEINPIISFSYNSGQSTEIIINTNNLFYLPSTIGSQPITYSLKNGSNLPPGLSINSENGIISGNITIPYTPQIYNSIIIATGPINSFETTFTIIVKDKTIQNFNYNNGNDYIGDANSSLNILPSSNTGTNIVYSISPTITTSYPNLTFNTSTGRISGTLFNSARNIQYTITANNGNNFPVSTNFRIITLDVPPSGLSYNNNQTTIVEISTSVSYSPLISTGTNVTYFISPSLPAGLSINTSTGVISGTTPSSSNDTNYTITATNSNGNTTASFRIRVVLKRFTITSGFGTITFGNGVTRTVNGYVDGSWVNYGIGSIGSAIDSTNWLNVWITTVDHFSTSGINVIDINFYSYDTSTILSFQNNPSAFFSTIKIYIGNAANNILSFSASSNSSSRSVDTSSSGVPYVTFRWNNGNIFSSGQTYTMLLE